MGAGLPVLPLQLDEVHEYSDLATSANTKTHDDDTHTHVMMLGITGTVQKCSLWGVERILCAPTIPGDQRGITFFAQHQNLHRQGGPEKHHLLHVKYRYQAGPVTTGHFSKDPTLICFLSKTNSVLLQFHVFLATPESQKRTDPPPATNFFVSVENTRN